MISGNIMSDMPIMKHREFYAPGHFGNTYEVASEFEMLELLKDLKYWGFNGYADWFDSAGLLTPWAEKTSCEFSSLIWNKKKFAFKVANEMGLKTGLFVTPNHVFGDQLSRENQVFANHSRIMGQLVCPSTPEGRAVILDNYNTLFDDLYTSGIILDSIKTGPYDYGGCGCENCSPWILSFIEIASDIFEVAQKYFPSITFDLVGWWWSEKEHELISEWAKNNQYRAAVNSMALHIKYNEFAPGDVSIPQGSEKRAFVHIGYGNERKPEGIQDVYGHWGPVSASRRLPETLRRLSQDGINGYTAYAEGAYHDLNNAILASLSSGQASSVEQSLQEYASYYFNCDYKIANKWAQWIINYEDCDQSSINDAHHDLNMIINEMSLNEYNWRIEHWKYRVELFKLHYEISEISGWPAKKFELVEKWRKASNVLKRRVYGLGVVRHIFQEHYCGAPWYKEWEALQGRKKHELLDVEY